MATRYGPEARKRLLVEPLGLRAGRLVEQAGRPRTQQFLVARTWHACPSGRSTGPSMETRSALGSACQGQDCGKAADSPGGIQDPDRDERTAMHDSLRIESHPPSSSPLDNLGQSSRIAAAAGPDSTLPGLAVDTASS